MIAEMSQPSQENLESNSQHLSTPHKFTKRSRKKQQNAPIPVQDDEVAITQPALPILLQEMSTPLRLLVCSIGNPAPYTNTLHSAGHNVLAALATSISYPPFQKSREHGNGLVSQGPEFTLWQSRSLMNVSGTAVSAAWRAFQKTAREGEAKLVIIHDELELGLGEVKVRDGGASAKGHNGLKDIARIMKGQRYVRIGVGIGRPESREPNVVAGYVLRKMSGAERAKIEGSASRVEAELRRLVD